MKFYVKLSVVLVLFYSCTNHKSIQNNLIEKVIQHFYSENKNEEVLRLTQAALIDNTLSTDNKTILSLMRVAAFCEIGQLNEAKQVLSHIDTANIFKSSKLKYWYNSIRGLYLFRKNDLPQAYEVLQTTLQQKYDDRADALNYRLLARILFQTGEVNKASSLLAQSTELFTRLGFTKSVAINQKILGRYYASKQNYGEALRYLSDSRDILMQTKDSLEIFYININLLDVYLQQGIFLKAKFYALESHKYLKKDDYQTISIYYNNLGEIEYKLRNFKESRFYYLNTIHLNKDYLSSTLRIGNANLGISKTYFEEKKYNESLQYAQKALIIAQKANLSQLAYSTNEQLLQIYTTTNQQENILTALRVKADYLENNSTAVVRNSDLIYQSTINLIASQAEADNLRNERRMYIFLIVAGVLFTIISLVYGFISWNLFRSRNQVLKSLVKKNLQIIDEERKLNEQLKVQLLAPKPTRKINDDKKYTQLYVEFIDWLLAGTNLTNKDLSVEFVSKELKTNRDYLAKALGEQNTRFTEVINKYRIELAMRIMSDKNDIRSKYTLSIIASEVGFNSMSVFIDAFKRQTGLTPAQFRSSDSLNI